MLLTAVGLGLGLGQGLVGVQHQLGGAGGAGGEGGAGGWGCGPGEAGRRTRGGASGPCNELVRRRL
jgi:hypothetical protein